MKWTENSHKRMAASMAFGRRMADARFRRHLDRIGWRNPQRLVFALDDEPVSDVMNLMRVNGTPTPALIVIPAEQEPFGYRFIWVVSTEDHPAAPRLEVPPTTTVGMLYAALQPCGEYVPAEWSQPVRFERVPA
jgi:hypothetical protein